MAQTPAYNLKEFFEHHRKGTKKILIYRPEEKIQGAMKIYDTLTSEKAILDFLADAPDTEVNHQFTNELHNTLRNKAGVELCSKDTPVDVYLYGSDDDLWYVAYTKSRSQLLVLKSFKVNDPSCLFEEDFGEQAVETLKGDQLRLAMEKAKEEKDDQST